MNIDLSRDADGLEMISRWTCT